MTEFLLAAFPWIGIAIALAVFGNFDDKNEKDN